MNIDLRQALAHVGDWDLSLTLRDDVADFRIRPLTNADIAFLQNAMKGDAGEQLDAVELAKQHQENHDFIVGLFDDPPVEPEDLTTPEIMAVMTATITYFREHVLPKQLAAAAQAAGGKPPARSDSPEAGSPSGAPGRSSSSRSPARTSASAGKKRGGGRRT